MKDLFCGYGPLYLAEATNYWRLAGMGAVTFEPAVVLGQETTTRILEV